jgi:sigma-B regulation protein RsbU (phosphoserine phosphatase)
MNNKIVIIDDDRVTVRLIEGILTNSGFAVSAAGDGESGYALALQERPDIVVCDFLLPKIDGVEVARRIKAAPELSRTKVMLMTAVYKGPMAKNVLQDSGADEFIEKPFETSTLMKKIFKLCQEIVDADDKAA